RAAMRAADLDEARRCVQDALAPLPAQSATALVVSLGRQWVAGLRADGPTRARLSASFDRFRAALEQGRFPDAIAELKAANELTDKQSTEDWPVLALAVNGLADRMAA